MRPSILLRAASRADPRPPIVDIKHATFYRHPPTSTTPAEPLFKDLSFSLGSFPRPAQSWAIVGSDAEVRTNLLEAIRGNLHCTPVNARSYPYLSTDELKSKDPRLRSLQNAIGFVGFDAERGPATLRGAYLSARYESHREETDFTLKDYLMGKTALNASEELTYKPPEALFKDLTYILALRDLLDMPVSNLSNGQTRRSRIARALLFQPELLLLNSPFMGIDQYSQEMIDIALHQYNATYSPRLMFSLGSLEYMPVGVTHLAFLGPDQKIFAAGPKDLVYHEMKNIRKALRDIRTPNLPVELAKLSEDCYNLRQRQMQWGRTLRKDLGGAKRRKDGEAGKSVWTSRDGFPMIDERKIPLGDPVVEMHGVRLAYGDKTVLGNWKQQQDGKEKDGLWWSIRRGERWGVFGANGSGKTTLTAVVTSDHPQAYSLPVKIFGRSRLAAPGERNVSLFDLQQRIGISSPEVHAFFPKHLSIRRSLESAWADAPMAKVVLTSEMDAIVSAVLRWFQGDICPDLGANDLFEAESLRLRDSSNTEEGVLSSNNRKRFMEHYAAIINTTALDWADERKFGSLSFTSQRLVLFLRAIIKSPDLVILDEAFSGMDASLTQKCHAFLAWGENALLRYRNSPQGSGLSSETRTPATKKSDLSSFGLVKFPGLKDEQALIVISHTQEEVPGSVRQWMRLPEPESGEPAKFGVLDGPLEGDLGRWKEIWDLDRRPRMLKVERPRVVAAEATSDETFTIITDNWDTKMAELAGIEPAHASNGEIARLSTSAISPSQKILLQARARRHALPADELARVKKYEREYHARALRSESPTARQTRLERKRYLKERSRNFALSASPFDEELLFSNEADLKLEYRVSKLITRVLKVDKEVRKVIMSLWRGLRDQGLVKMPNWRTKAKAENIRPADSTALSNLQGIPIDVISRARFTPARYYQPANPALTDIFERVEQGVHQTWTIIGGTRRSLHRIIHPRKRGTVPSSLLSPEEVAARESRLFNKQVEDLGIEVAVHRLCVRINATKWEANKILKAHGIPLRVRQRKDSPALETIRSDLKRIQESVYKSRWEMRQVANRPRG
jgi:ABC-type molybdenum transport system ATPase subunit/photorepair protein PhrA